MQFKYYLNPTINDRNVEFDPKQNLMKNLKSLRESVNLEGHAFFAKLTNWELFR